jgi:hypothetical protein
MPFGVKGFQIGNKCHELRKEGFNRGKTPHNKKLLPINEIVDLYRYGYSPIEIGELYSTSDVTILSRLKANGERIRTWKESMLLSLKNKKWEPATPNKGRFRENSFHWKGGKTYEGEYESILIGYGVYQRTHRRIMEHLIGRKLSANEVVHHINSIKIDNAVSNLLVMTKSTHAKIHHIMKNLKGTIGILNAMFWDKRRELGI